MLKILLINVSKIRLPLLDLIHSFQLLGPGTVAFLKGVLYGRHSHYDITVPLDTGVLKAAPLYQEFHSVERSDAHIFFLPITLLIIADVFLYRTQQPTPTLSLNSLP